MEAWLAARESIERGFLLIGTLGTRRTQQRPSGLLRCWCNVPGIRDQFETASPPLYNGILEPRFSQICMVRNDDLKTWSQHFDYVKANSEKSNHCFTVLIRSQVVDAYVVYSLWI